MSTLLSLAQQSLQKNNPMVQALLAMDATCHQWLAEVPFDDVKEFLACSEAYNGYFPDAAVDLLDAVDEYLPREDLGVSNPNTGKRGFFVEVGNEGSRVIYIHMRPHFIKPWTTDTWAQELRTLAQIANCDEADVHPKMNYPEWFRFRFWWD